MAPTFGGHGFVRRGSSAARSTTAAPAAKRLDPRRVRNEFRGNDFRDAELLDVAFIAGVDMHLQRFPEDELHVRIEDFRRHVQKARSEVEQWDERGRDKHVAVARGWTPRIKASDRLQARVWDLLEHI